MITYRVANPADAEAIAQLHAQSWQRHYRGIWSDAFLDGPVTANRMELWKKRFSTPKEDQYVVVAESADQLVGFVCMYAEDDPQYGALLDNLHVSSILQGKGVGKELMQKAAAWLYARDPAAMFYLWVLAENETARQFYEHLGGEKVELVAVQNPDGSYSDCYRYVWKDLIHLMTP